MTGHRAVDAEGSPYEAPGFDYGKHDRWVAEGFCPVVSGAAMFCGKRPGHGGRHGSAVQFSAEFGDVSWLEWDH